MTGAGDVPVIFEQQSDPVAARMAGVVPRGREEFEAHWGRLLTALPARLVARVIEADGVVVGAINCFQRDGLEEELAVSMKAGGVGRGESGRELDFIGYWIGREHWGRGIATRALALMVEEVAFRPLHARTARGNVASQRVLERNGFVVVGSRCAPAEGRFLGGEEVLWMLG